ncbi:MAG: hypothetical protein V4616_00600 [Bacteroidota bacterium]
MIKESFFSLCFVLLGCFGCQAQKAVELLPTDTVSRLDTVAWPNVEPPQWLSQSIKTTDDYRNQLTKKLPIGRLLYHVRLEEKNDSVRCVITDTQFMLYKPVFRNHGLIKGSFSWNNILVLVQCDGKLCDGILNNPTYPNIIKVQKDEEYFTFKEAESVQLVFYLKQGKAIELSRKQLRDWHKD